MSKANARVDKSKKKERLNNLNDKDVKEDTKPNLKILEHKEKGAEVPAEPEERDTLTASTRQLIDTLQQPSVNFDKFSSVPFVGLTDVEIPEMKPNLLKVRNELLIIPKNRTNRRGINSNNFIDYLTITILDDIAKIMPNQDRSVFAELSKERATMTTGQKCLNGMSIHEFATQAEGTSSAVTDQDLISNYNLVRTVNEGDVSYEAADVIVDSLDYHLYQEISRLIDGNLITKMALYEMRTEEFVNTGCILIQPEGLEERGLLHRPRPQQDIMAVEEVIQFMELATASIVLTALSKSPINYRTNQQIVSMYKSRMTSSLTATDMIESALTSLPEPNMNDMFAIIMSCVCERARIQVCFDLLNRPIDVQDFISALMIYMYWPEEAIDPVTYHQVCAIVNSAFTGASYATELARPIATLIGSITGRGVRQCASPTLQSSIGTSTPNQPHAYLCPMNIDPSVASNNLNRMTVAQNANIRVGGRALRANDVMAISSVPAASSDSCVFLISLLDHVSSSIPIALLNRMEFARNGYIMRINAKVMMKIILSQVEGTIMYNATSVLNAITSVGNSLSTMAYRLSLRGMATGQLTSSQIIAQHKDSMTVVNDILKDPNFDLINAIMTAHETRYGAANLVALLGQIMNRFGMPSEIDLLVQRLRLTCNANLPFVGLLNEVLLMRDPDTNVQSDVYFSAHPHAIPPMHPVRMTIESWEARNYRAQTELIRQGVILTGVFEVEWRFTTEPSEFLRNTANYTFHDTIKVNRKLVFTSVLRSDKHTDTNVTNVYVYTTTAPYYSANWRNQLREVRSISRS